MTKSNKKGHAGLIIFILILILAIGGGTGFYFYQRQQPRKALEHFLDSMKKMDFDTMESLIQSSDCLLYTSIKFLLMWQLLLSFLF